MNHAMLARFMAPIRAEEFLERYWSRRYLHISGQERKFADLFSWDQLDRVLEGQRVDGPEIAPGHPVLRLKHKQRTIPLPVTYNPRDGRARLDAAGLYRLFRQGASFVLNRVDELSHRVRNAAEGLSASFGGHVSVNLYASAGHEEGFGLHWDDHDVFVVQLSGTKVWSLYGPTRAYPLSQRDDVPAPLGEPLETVLLQTGDCLYLPKGHWHNVRGQDDPSLHLTFGVTNVTGVDVLRWLILDELARDELFRADVPRFAAPEGRAAWARAIREKLIQLWNDETLLGRFLARHESMLPGRPHLSFAALFGGQSPAGRMYRLVAQTAPTLTRDEEKGTVCLCAGGREHVFPVRSEAILRRLGDLDVVPSEELAACANLEPVEQEALMTELLEAGVVYEVPADEVSWSALPGPAPLGD
jgi:ribosomal protein L16 Arg81 hydroxylase